MSTADGESEIIKEKHQLSVYEELFSDRFTDNDAEYLQTSQQADPPPPCVENWYTRPKRTFDWTRQEQPVYIGVIVCRIIMERATFCRYLVKSL